MKNIEIILRKVGSKMQILSMVDGVPTHPGAMDFDTLAKFVFAAFTSLSIGQDIMQENFNLTENEFFELLEKMDSLDNEIDPKSYDK